MTQSLGVGSRTAGGGGGMEVVSFVSIEVLVIQMRSSLLAWTGFGAPLEFSFCSFPSFKESACWHLTFFRFIFVMLVLLLALSSLGG